MLLCVSMEHEHGPNHLFCTLPVCNERQKAHQRLRRKRERAAGLLMDCPVTCAAAIPKPLVEAMKEFATATGVTASAVIRDALTAYLLPSTKSR